MRFELLRRQYGSLIIPKEVFDEVVTHDAGLPGAAEVGAADWIEVRRVKGMSTEGLCSCAGLGQGEAGSAYVQMLRQGIRIDLRIVRNSIEHFGLDLL